MLRQIASHREQRFEKTGKGDGNIPELFCPSGRRSLTRNRLWTDRGWWSEETFIIYRPSDRRFSCYQL